MKSALCPVCGSVLEVILSSSDPGLSCPTCHWIFDSGKTTGLPDGTAAPIAFLEDLPSREIGQDIFGPLLTTVKPRSLLWNWRMKATAVLTVLIIAILIWIVPAHSVRGRFNDGGSILILVCWVTALIALPLVPELSNRELLTDGEIAVGRIIYQIEQPGKDRRSAILYAFADGRNRGFVGRGFDISNSLGRGAPVIIFYDPLNPNKNVAMECSRFSVKSTQ